MVSSRSVNGILFRLKFRQDEGLVDVERGDSYCGYITYGNDFEQRLTDYLIDLSKRDFDQGE